MRDLTFKVKLRVEVEIERYSVLLIYKAVTYTSAVLKDRAFSAHGLYAATELTRACAFMLAPLECVHPAKN